MALIPKELYDQIKRWSVHEPILDAAFEAYSDEGEAIGHALLEYIEGYRESIDRLVKMTMTAPPPVMVGSVDPLFISIVKNLVGSAIVKNDNGIQVTIVIPKNSWTKLLNLAQGE